MGAAVIPKIGRSLTKRLPMFRGLSTILRIYLRVLPPEASVYRISDFDGDLLMDVDLRDCIGVNLWHCPNLFERMERRLFCDSVEPGMVVLDVGANIGVYTLLAAKRLRHRGRVIAVEPDPRNLYFLRRHVQLNGFDDVVTIHGCAAFDQDCQVSLYLQESGNRGGSSLFAGAGTTIAVPAVRLDTLLESQGIRHVDVCKIDVEGSESAVLRGMERTLLNSARIRLLVEYSERWGKGAQETLGFLRSHFGRIDVVGRGSLRALDRPPAYGNLWCHRE